MEIAGEHRLLSADAAHFNEAFKVFLDKNNMQEAKLELVQKYVPKALLHTSSRSKEMAREMVNSVLGVGSSKGDIDLSILEEITKYQLVKGSEKAMIYNRVVEPNPKAIGNFKSTAEEWSKKNQEKVDVSFDWVQATFQEYQSQKHESNKFQLIHFVGSIYFVDPEDAIRHCLEKELAENGVVFIAGIGVNSYLVRYQEKFHDTGICPFLPGYIRSTSNYICDLAQKNNWCHEYYEANWYQDVTEVANDPESRESQMLVDFITHTINFEAVKGKKMAEMVRKFLIEESESKPDGRRVIDVNKYGVVLIFRS